MPLYDKVIKYVKSYGATPYSYGESDSSDSKLLSYKFNLPTINNKSKILSMEVDAIVLGERINYQMSAVGKSVALNSLAALTAAKLAGFKIKDVVKYISKFKARKNTLEIFVRNDVLFFDCSHNLEIPSILAAFDLLKTSSFSGNGRKILIISRIVNLGKIAEDFHMILEKPFIKYGFDKVFIHNPNHEWDKIYPNLINNINVDIANNAKDIIDKFKSYIKKEDSVLILGASRGCDFGLVLPKILKIVDKIN